MSKSSGIGLWYGYNESNRAVLEDLLKDWEYDWVITPDQLVTGEYETPVSVIARLPMTLADARPWSPMGWAAFNGYLDRHKEA